MVWPKFKQCLPIPAPSAFSSGLDYDDDEIYTSYCRAVFTVHITPLWAKFLIRSTATRNSDGRQITQRFFLVVRQMSGNTSQRRGTVHTLPN